MITLDELISLFHDRNKTDKLIDIQDTTVDTTLPPKERLESYVAQINNPYHFKCGNIDVSIKYSNTDKTLKDILTKYFIQTKL